MAPRLLSTAGASGDTTGAPGPVTDWHCAGYPLRFARRHGPQPVCQPGQTGSIMVHGPFTHPATFAVAHPDLMLLGAPINAHKPLIRPGSIISCWVHVGRHDTTHGSLISLKNVSLWCSPVGVTRPCPGARSATSSQRDPTVSLAREQVRWRHSRCRPFWALRARRSPRPNSILSDLDSSLMVQGLSPRLAPSTASTHPGGV